MAGKTDLSTLNCSLARALGAVGDWWTLLILRDAFFGSTRFSEFIASLGIARNILAARLDALVDAEMMVRDGTAARPIYRLTQKGNEILPALVALMQWGDKWESGGKPPVLLTDDKGHKLAPVRAENRVGETIGADSIRFVPGPGANAETRAFFKQRKKA